MDRGDVMSDERERMAEIIRQCGSDYNEAAAALIAAGYGDVAVAEIRGYERGIATARAAQINRALIACAGLDLPADVPEGAVKRLVEAARLLAQRSATALTVRADIPLDDARHKTEDALHELGVKL